MTVKQERAFRNAVASTRIEGLTVSKKTEQDCLRYLNGQIDAASLVHEILHRKSDAVMQR